MAKYRGKEYSGHPMFYELLTKMAEIHSSKNKDYATGHHKDPLANFKLSKQMGIPAWKGALVRITDKISRLWSFAKKEDYAIKSESFEDTLIDLANYSLLCLILYKESKQK